MSKMGQELDRKLDEAKYDMYEALQGLCPCQRPIPNGNPPFEWAISERAMAVVRKALAKVEGK